MNTALVIAFLLVLLGFIWGFWLIFRKDMVTQPVKVITYFVGAVLAVLIAIFITVRIFPGIAVRFLDMATTSSDVQSLKQKTDQLFGSMTVTPAPVAPVVPGPPTTPVSPVVTPTLSIQRTGQTYVVQLGDTLYSIARKFGVSAQAIQTANGITDPNNIKAGQVLIIPKP